MKAQSSHSRLKNNQFLRSLDICQFFIRLQLSFSFYQEAILGNSPFNHRTAANVVEFL